MAEKQRPQWLSIVGVGEDGLEGLSPVGRSRLQQAAIVAGGARHLAMLPATDDRPQIHWTSPLQQAIQQILAYRGQPLCVLASGDPMCYGIGVTLLRHLPLAELLIVPAPSAFSLACARLGWPLADIDTLSLCGRDPALLNALIYPGARLLVLSADRTTPATVAQQLTQRGYGASELVILEHLGGRSERLLRATAAVGASAWDGAELADLNTIAITCQSDQALGDRRPPRLPGLPDAAYQHDGQLTKQEIRAVTLAALAPLPGQLLWDVGAGCGSIGIEWMRSDRRCRAIAIEPQPTRQQHTTANAVALGVPQLQLITAAAPAALAGLPPPDAIFIGGGLTTPELLETCWQALPSAGRLVANAVTVEGELLLLQWQQAVGGSLTRLAVQRAEPVGKFLGWRSLAPVTQWAVTKGLTQQ